MSTFSRCGPCRGTLSGTQPPVPRCRLPVRLLVALLTVGIGWALVGVHPAAALQAGPSPVCPAVHDAEPVSLAEAWERARTLEPGYRARTERVAAEEASRSAVTREWFPELAAEGLGNHGQRLSPGEERVLGVGPRGEFRLLGAWTLLDSSRGWRAREAEFRHEEARAAGELFSTEHRAAVARVYLEAGRAQAQRQLLVEQRGALDELAGLVEVRIREGVDPRWESYLLEEALARSDRLLSEAEQADRSARTELSTLVDECVRPGDRPGAALAHPGDLRPGQMAGENPEADRLLREAAAQHALSRAVAGQDRFLFQLVGGVGPNYSRAFEGDRIRQEYLVGLSGSWRPDFFGIRRQEGAAESARARALEAEATSQRLQARRQAERLAEYWAHAEAREEDLERELAAAERRSELATLRWREGVGRWSEVIDARERLDELRIQKLGFRHETALALVELAAWTGRTDELPSWLDLEAHR